MHIKRVSILVSLLAVTLYGCATGIIESRFGSPAQQSKPRGEGQSEPEKQVNVAEHSGIESVNGVMPEIISIKTATQTFCKRYAFSISDGRIYYKSQLSGVSPSRWKLLTGTGLPHSSDAGFIEPYRIVEISADDESLMAFSNEGKMYECNFEGGLGKAPFVWLDTFGWPDKMSLVQNDLVLGNRAWAIGTRGKDVLWFEDIFGNQHHYGTMGIKTIYFLTKNGQDIRYADTGLPQDFSHSILGPERGSFISRSLSASASTIFLINDTGEMYTRLADFDTLGNDPMFFKYAYTKEPFSYPGSDYRSNFTAWGLPSEDWKKESSILLTGKARISSYITILQTGQGNFARELRVAGVSSEGKTGYYFKNIADSAWSFKLSPLIISETAFLSAATTTAKGDRGKKRETAYEGAMWVNDERQRDLSFRVPDFPLSEGSCHLVITYRGEELKIKLFPVDIWTYMKRYNPGLDNTPKNIFVTLSFTAEQLAAISPEFFNLIEPLLLNRNLVLFSCRAEVTDAYFILDFDTGSDDRLSLLLTREGVPEVDIALLRKADVNEDKLVVRGLDPSLILTNTANLTVSSKSELERVIAANNEYRELVAQELKRYQAYHNVAGVSRFSYAAMDLLTTVTFLDQLNYPKFKTITRHGADIMATNAEVYRDMSDSRKWVYSKIIELVDIRISEYEKALKAFDSGKVKTSLDPDLRNTFTEYFSLVSLPSRVTGTAHDDGDRKATVLILKSSPLFPGLIYESGGRRTLIELKDSAKHILDREGETLAQKPFKVSVLFHPFTGSIGRKSVEDLAGITGKLEWDGHTLTLWRNTSLFSKALVFTGDVTATP